MRKIFVVMLLICTGTYADTKSIYITGASYYDMNADGFIDSINLIYSGPILESDLGVITNFINLPSWRNFSITSVSLLSRWSPEPEGYREQRTTRYIC